MSKKQDIYALLLIWFVGILANWSGIIAREFWWTDETRHAMGGVFFFDFFRDMPLTAPLDYIHRYFAQYPALAFNWYPPFFSIVLGAAMEFFGISEVVAHATVLAFWLVGLTAWYVWVTSIWGRPIALASSLVLLVVPEMALWSRSVMLDVPALSMSIFSILVFERYLKNPTHRHSILLGLTLSAALLLKQSVLFLLPTLLIYTLVTGQWRSALWRKESSWVVGLVILTLAILAFHAVKFGAAGLLAATVGDSFIRAGTAPPRWSWERWLVYGNALYTTAGPALLGAAVIGLVLCLQHRPRKPASQLLLAWFVAWYVVDTLLFGVPTDSYRYTLYVMPVIAFFASYGLVRFATQPLLLSVWMGALTIWIVWHAVILIQKPHNYVAGYEEAAKVVSTLPNSGTILVAARNDGNFIFYLRTFDQHRERVILRVDKLLVTMSVNKLYGVTSNVKEPSDIRRLLQQNAVRWIVIESRDLIGLKEFEMLRDLLRTADFRLIADIPIHSNRLIYADMTIQVYENLAAPFLVDGKVSIEFPHLGRIFQFQLDPTGQ